MKAVLFLIATIAPFILCADKLTVDAYVESECPYCIMFITNQLKKALEVPDIEKILDVRVIPYGNAF